MTRDLVVTGLGSAPGLSGPMAVAAAEGRITALGPDADPRPSERRLDARGLVAVPGFIELQLNGAFGHDFTSDPGTMWEVGAGLARHGVTSFLPTIISSPPSAVDAAVAAWSSGSAAGARGAAPLGLHLEGPYLSAERAGAHDPSYLRDPDPTEVRRWADSGAVRLMTLAPERAGALDAIRTLADRDVVPAVGHTAADAVAAAAAVDAGARYATHLFNAMPPLGHRAPGAAGVLLADPRVTVGLILDRHHLDPIVVSLVERLARGRVSLVSDAIAALGLGEGAHELAGRRVEVRDGAVRLPDGTLAGSATSLDACVRAFAAMTGSAVDAIEAVTAVPARLLGLSDGRGRLSVGGVADIVLLDDELEVQATIVAGDVVHAAEWLGWD